MKFPKWLTVHHEMKSYCYLFNGRRYRIYATNKQAVKAHLKYIVRVNPDAIEIAEY